MKGKRATLSQIIKAFSTRSLVLQVTEEERRKIDEQNAQEASQATKRLIYDTYSIRTKNVKTTAIGGANKEYHDTADASEMAATEPAAESPPSSTRTDSKRARSQNNRHRSGSHKQRSSHSKLRSKTTRSHRSRSSRPVVQPDESEERKLKRKDAVQLSFKDVKKAFAESQVQGKLKTQSRRSRRRTSVSSSR